MKNILIWDAEGSPPQLSGITILWRAFTDGSSRSYISIPRLVEENADELRARYLAWVYELGEFCINGNSLVNHLQLRPGFSYWWMTLLTEKCNYIKSPHIDDAIRLLAFTDWAADRSITYITLNTANVQLADSLRQWCKRMGIEFEVSRLSKPEEHASFLRRSYAKLPKPIQAWIWILKYLIERWPLRGVGLETWRQSAGVTTFVSYLFDLKSEDLKAGIYKSRYWGHLPEMLWAENCKTNWLHLYVRDPLLPDSKKAADAIRAFNKVGRGIAVHTTLDSFLSLYVLCQALKDWSKLAWKGRKLNAFIANAPHNEFYLWSLFAEDWRNSTCGVVAIHNTLYRSLFAVALKALPKQYICCYLQENQAWEFALIQQWRLTKKGRLVGVPHTLLRFWDLRYFFDPRSYLKSRNTSLPQPDQVAVNGLAATNAFLKGGYSPNDLVQVEALRYLYLDNAYMQSRREGVPPQKGLRLLVLGDYLERNTLLQMRLLSKAAESLPIGTVITVKAHPACPIRSKDYPKLHIRLEIKSLTELLLMCDLVYTSAFTTAAVDAYCAGVPVISVADPNTLNLSPLRDSPNVQFVSTSVELAAAVNLITSAKKITKIDQPFFNTGDHLNLWRSLINL